MYLTLQQAIFFFVERVGVGGRERFGSWIYGCMDAWVDGMWEWEESVGRKGGMSIGFFLFQFQF